MAQGQLAPAGAYVDITFRASEVMATAYVAVMLDTSNEGYVSLATDGATAIGVLQNTAAAVGDQVVVRVAGQTYVTANNTFSIGDFVNSGAATGLVDNVGDKEYATGIALTAATAANDLVVIQLTLGANKTA